METKRSPEARRRFPEPEYSEGRRSVPEDEAVSDARLCDEKLGFGGIGFEFLAKVTHVNTQGAGLGNVAGAPDFAQEMSVSEDLAGVMNKQDEQRIFRGGELHEAPVELDRPA